MVVGGGPVGLSLAMFLAKLGFPVHVYEGRADPRVATPPGGRSISLTLAERAWKAFRELGIDAHLRARTTPLSGRLIHGLDGHNQYQPYGNADEAIWAVSRSLLNMELLHLASKTPNVTLHFDHRCRGVDVRRKEVSFEPQDGSGVVVLRPAVVFACDGAHSTVRRSLLSEPKFQFFQKVATTQYKELTMPRGPDGKTPMRDRVLHLWPRAHEHMLVGFPNIDQTITAGIFLPAGAFSKINTFEDLERLFDELYPDVRPLMPNLAQDFFARPPSMLVSSRCAPWTFGGWLTLVGDAAHSVVPCIGQGLNAGLEDCTTLSALIGEHGDDWNTVLPRFEALRRPNCDAVMKLAEEHCSELADGAAHPDFVLRRSVERRLQLLFPGEFAGLYNRVTFETTPFADIARDKAAQDKLLDELVAVPAVRAAPDSDEATAEIRRRFRAARPPSAR